MDQRPKVLIVEDELLIACTMQEVLGLVGFDVIGVAATVSEASNARTVIVGVRILRNRLGEGRIYHVAKEMRA